MRGRARGSWEVAGLFVVLAAAPAAGARVPLPTPGLSYRIEVSLEPATRALAGTLELDWTNPGERAVDAVPLHLYLNAFENEHTTWMREVARDVEEFLEVHPDPWGFVDLERVEQVGVPAPLAWSAIQPDDGNPLDRTLALVRLAEPVAPGGRLRLRVAFRGRLPVPIARTGGFDDFFLVAQWFPKLAAFETRGMRGARASGFRASQFHGPTEFYADFADYDVRIDVPADFTVGATGRLVTSEVEGGRLHVHHTAHAVHDFAFVAGRALADAVHPHTPPGDGPAVRVRYLVPAGLAHQVPRWRRAVEAAVDVLARRVGPYPYDTLTVVCPPYPHVRTGGMEYPTLITGAFCDPVQDGFPFGDVRFPELVLVHEFGHQYFYGVLASDEREDAFLDEGFNSYWESEILTELFGAEASVGRLLSHPIDARGLRVGGRGALDGIREPVRKRPSWLFYPETGRAQIYSRPAVILDTAAALFGTGTVDAVFAAYYRRFAFRHPGPEDFLALAAGVGGEPLAGFLREALSRPEVPDYRVAEATSDPWRPPLGRVLGPEGEQLVTQENRDAAGELGLDPAAREEDGRVQVEVTDPGWFGPEEDRRGSVTRRALLPERGEASADPDRSQHDTRVRVAGPAWRHLPVTVVFRFTDGAVVRDVWDGRAAWRAWRFLRPARLLDVRLDPDRALAVDVRPDNDARAVEPDRDFAFAISSWLAAFAHWLAAGATLWL